MTDHQKKTGFSAGLVLGAILGGAAALMLSPKSGKEHRKFIAAKLKELREGLDKFELQDKVEQIFGDVSEQSIEFYQQSRDELAKRIENARDRWDELDTDKYKELVREAVDQVREKGNFSSDHMNQLKDYLVEDWKTMATTKDKKRKKS